MQTAKGAYVAVQLKLHLRRLTDGNALENMKLKIDALNSQSEDC